MIDINKFKSQVIFNMTNHLVNSPESAICTLSINCPIEDYFNRDGNLRDFCFYYAQAVCLKRLKIPFEVNDWEFIRQPSSLTIKLCRRRTPFKQQMLLDHRDLDIIATLRLSAVPNLALYTEFLKDTIVENGGTY